MAVSMIIFTVITGFFAIRGYFNGFLRSCIRTFSVLAGYAAAFLFSKPASIQLEQYVPLDGIMLYIASGSAIFFAVIIVIQLIVWLSLGSKEDDELSTKSRLGGVIVGALIGAFIGVIFVYTWGVYIDAKNRNSTEAHIEPAIQSAAKVIVSKTAGSILALSNTSETTAKMSEAFLAAPIESADRISRITNNTDLQELLNNPRTQRLMREGDVDSLMQAPSFNRLMKNEDMRVLMENSGFSMDNSTDIRATAKKLTSGYQSFQLAKNDPRVQNILNDPDFQAQLRADNKLPLLFNPNLNILANIIFVEGASNMTALEKKTAELDYIDNNEMPSQENANNGESTTVYRRKDKNGNVIYSDRPKN